MSNPPSFSSFPELTGPPSNEASSSKLPAPSFGSFPEVTKPVSREKRRHRDEDADRERRRRSRSNENRDDREERRRARRREERKERERDDEERLRKEERRRRDRERAERLVKGERDRGDSTALHNPAGPANKKQDLYEVEDGGAWYESVTRSRPRAGYEEPYDPTAPSTSFKDTAGDRDAAKYNTSASHASARYHRDGGGRVLGLNDGIRIVVSRDRKEKGVELAPRGKPYIPRYSGHSLEGSSSRHLGRRLLRPAEDNSFDPASAFVEFQDEADRRESDAEDTPDYRDISRPSNEVEDSLAVDTTRNYSTLENDVRQRTVDAERHLRSHPEDVDAWIAFSTLHLKLSPELANRPVNASVDPLSLPQNRASAEVTLSILARALDAHERNFLSPKLHIAYLRAAELFWPADKVTGRWKNVIRELEDRRRRNGIAELDVGMMDIWLGYIDWRQSRGFGKSEDQANGGVDDVIAVYAECVKQVAFGTGSLPTPPAEENLLYLLLRMCTFMKQAGLSERAFATFQAMMELTLFKPDHLRPPHHANVNWFEGVLAEFEDFWDEEGPRIGEKDGTGWKNAAGAELLGEEVNEPEIAATDDFARWLEAERHAECTRSRPGRTKNFDDDEDVFRVVLFADVQPFLFPIRSPEVRLQLVYAFFNFLGLPFSPSETSTAMPITRDPHLRGMLAYDDAARSAFWPSKPGNRAVPWQTVGGEPMSAETGTALQHPFGCPVKCWASQPASLFAQTGRWFRDLGPTDLEAIDVELVRNAFELLRPLVPDPSFTLAYFAFESAVSPKNAVKAAKAVLALESDDLMLWNGYAQLERQRGKISVARTVYATALQAGIDATEDDRQEVWASWADMENEQGSGLALQVTVMAAGEDLAKLKEIAEPGYQAVPLRPLALLKAKQYYAQRLSPSSPGALTLCAIFAYATDGIDAARDVCVRQLQVFSPDSSDAECVYQLLTRMLYIHTSRNAAPAALARDTLEVAIAAFPNNTSFLSLYLFGELGNRVYGRVQRLVSKMSFAEDAGVVGHLWAVWAEAMSSHRTFWDKHGGGAERVRTALDKAVNSRTGRYNVTLWKLYIEFEGLMRRYKAAKQLCYRAISALPGCKELYLLPFSSALREQFEDRELRQMAELMTERGIRVRIPFEGFFDPSMTDDAAMVLPEDEELREDELAFLREREVLKPY